MADNHGSLRIFGTNSPRHLPFRNGGEVHARAAPGREGANFEIVVRARKDAATWGWQKKGDL